MQSVKSFFGNPTRLLGAAVVALALVVMPAKADANNPPVITFFSFMNPLDNYFAFIGQIEDESPYSCAVEFGEYLYGGYTSPDYDGTFCLVVQINPEDYWYVTVWAIDNANQKSNVMMTYVYH